MAFSFASNSGRKERETYCPGIPIQIAARESLIRTIKESIVSLLHKDVGKLAPLVLRWVHTGGIMRASVQEEHRALRGGLERVEEAVKIEPDSRRIIVRVGDRFDANVAEDCEVVYYAGRSWYKGKQGKGRTHSRLDRLDRLALAR